MKCTVCDTDKAQDEFYPKRKLCKSCDKARTQAWRIANRERNAENARNWRSANPVKAKEMGKAAAVKHSSRNVERAEKWSRENAGRRREIARNWVRDNPEKSNAATVKYRAAKLMAVAKWANLGAIAEIYEGCAAMSKVTGVKYEVDHIVPLRSDIVCGLHVEHNLQIIPAVDNRIKSNRTWPDMP